MKNRPYGPDIDETIVSFFLHVFMSYVTGLQLKRMYLTNRNRRVIHTYNGKSVTKLYYDRPGSIVNMYLFVLDDSLTS